MERIQIVTQRISRGRLLVSEVDDRWVSIDNNGLVLYVSFILEETESSSEDSIMERIPKIVKGLMTAKLATVSGWRSDHSDAQSIQSLVSSDPPNPTCIVIIPQATLAGKLRPGDKYLKYHRQVGRDRGNELYKFFINQVITFFNHSSSLSVTSGDRNKCEIIPNILSIVWGTFGGRQGFELMSSGPSTHVFQY